MVWKVPLRCGRGAQEDDWYTIYANHLNTNYDHMLLRREDGLGALVLLTRSL